MKKKESLNLITCECGYQNKPENIRKYGTCTRCHKVLDEKIYFKYQMYNKLRLWRKKW